MSLQPNTKGTGTTNPFIFPTGTVKLLVTYEGEPLVGSVSADALVLASPVWKKFLFPPWDIMFTSDIHGQQKQINCTEDDGKALLVLLNIIHLNFDKIPPTMDYATLLQVAVLVDQYDCIKIVRPWLEGWMKDEEIESVEENQEGWLFIAWVFGREAIFSALALLMVKSCQFRKISACGTRPAETVLTMGGKPLTDPMPPEIIESIIRCRNQTLKLLLNIPSTRLEKLENAMRWTAETLCSADSNSQACDAAIYGSCIFALAQQNIRMYPAPTAEHFDRYSVTSLGKLLADVKLRYIQPVQLSPPLPDGGQAHGGLSSRAAAPVINKDDHIRCAIGMSASVRDVLDAIQSPVLDSHRRHMQIQRGEAVKMASERDITS
ncbi:hypothetical protein VTL71DRAFT_13220 [Oculimacula yallundae]|uniref:Nuclear pore protein n=1 Tax=Oculimacula yallundae TaxID=86028 RepID=A0ABR4CJQ2_9HELO